MTLQPGRHMVLESVRLRNEFERIRLDFIRTDLELCFTLADTVRVHYNMGNREHAERTLAAVRKGYSDMLRFYSQARLLTVEQEEEFRSKFNRLREELDGLTRLA